MLRPRARGFSIIELAVALFLIALLLGGTFVPLQAQLDARRTEQTDAILARAREALIGYVAAYGHFPCPADELSGGVEPPLSDHATGKCPAFYGYLPAAALGLQPTDAQGYAVDAWGGAASRIRYAVAPQAIGKVSSALTRVNGMRSAGIGTLADPALSLFHVCATGVGVTEATSCGSGSTLVSTTPAVIWSLGANGAAGGTSRDEAQNPNAKGEAPTASSSAAREAWARAATSTIRWPGSVCRSSSHGSSPQDSFRDHATCRAPPVSSGASVNRTQPRSLESSRSRYPDSRASRFA